MALGKNMKVEKLIPLKPKKGSVRSTDSQKQENISKTPEIESLDELEKVSNEINKEEILTSKNVSEETSIVNVDLDAFFNELDGKDSEQTTQVENSKNAEEINSEASISLGQESIVETVIESSDTEKPITKVETTTLNFEDVETDSIKIGFKPSKRKTQKRIFIDIEGEATIKNAELLYSKVNGVFEHFDHVEINMTNIKSVDLSVIQLFHAIRVNYFPQDKFIYLNADFARDDRKLLNTCGFTEFQTQKVAQN